GVRGVLHRSLSDRRQQVTQRSIHQSCGPDTDPIQVLERNWRPYELSVDGGSVLAVEILDRCLPSRHDDAGVMTRDRGMIDLDPPSSAAPQLFRAFRARPLAGLPDV